jgi:hypothetical protein
MMGFAMGCSPAMPLVTTAIIGPLAPLSSTAIQLSGTLKLPFDLPAASEAAREKDLVYLHAFFVDGKVVSEAQVGLTRRDAKNVDFDIAGLPEGRLVVLAATIHPGFVLRALVPPIGGGKVWNNLVVDARSEAMFEDMVALGTLPDVAPAGLGSVIAQGGLNPALAARAYTDAAASLDTVTSIPWAAGIEGTAHLKQALLAIAGSLKTSAETRASGASLTKLPGSVLLENKLRRQLKEFDRQVALRAAAQRAPKDVVSSLSLLYARLEQAVNFDVPAPVAAAVPASSAATALRTLASLRLLDEPPEGFVPRIPFPYRDLSARNTVSNLYDANQPLSSLLDAVVAPTLPNGAPFSEDEIYRALQAGKGPYRQACSQTGFDPAQQTCAIVVNPVDQAIEVLVRRKTKNIEALAASFKQASDQQDGSRMTEIAKTFPAIASFSEARPDWTSPVGTWRLRIFQETGNRLAPDGFYVINDSEAVIQSPQGTATSTVGSGDLTGVLSVWIPDRDNAERLDNFAMQFHWDNEDKSIDGGVLTGDRRDSSFNGFIADYNAANRYIFNATFDASMIATTKIEGKWQSENETVSGSLEMIRGDNSFSH